MFRKQQKVLFHCIFYIIFIVHFFNKQTVAFRVCGNFCGANWCNGGKRSEWTHDNDHCGPEYLVPQVNKKTGGPSCADACCKNHDMCCSPGGNDLPNSILLTKDCNKEIVACLAACDKFDSSCSRGIIPVPSIAVFAAMDLVQNWCCGSRCPKTTGGNKNNNNDEDEKQQFNEVIKIQNLRHQNNNEKLFVSEATIVENKYLLSTAFSDEKCTEKDEVSTIATLCNSYQMVNKTASTIVRCLGVDENNNNNAKPYCSQEFYTNSDCSGEPAVNKNASCDQTCDVFPVTKTDNDSKRGTVIHEDEIISKMNYPIVKIYTSNDCSGSVQSYLGFGGCKPAPDATNGNKAKAWARVCKGDGLTYSCEYSDESCETEIICFPLENTKPSTCKVVGGSGTGVAESSQEWICKGSR